MLCRIEYNSQSQNIQKAFYTSTDIAASSIQLNNARFLTLVVTLNVEPPLQCYVNAMGVQDMLVELIYGQEYLVKVQPQSCGVPHHE